MAMLNALYNKNLPVKHIYSFLLMILLSSNAYATWSIIAVDHNTGEVGVVGASCTFDVSGIASVVPGKGAIVVQAASSYFARMRGERLMETGTNVEEILTAMREDEFDPEQQQYGVVALYGNSTPLVYSGSQIANWSGEKIGNDFAVLGNTLVGQEVLDNAYEAFDKNRDKPLAERLMLALKAGADVGGDNRCGKQYARSAFIMVYQPQNGAILKLAIQGVEYGGKPAVALLNAQFDLWRRE